MDCTNLQIYIILLVCAYIASLEYAVLDTIVNPILSDHFGFRVRDEYFAVLGVAAGLFISSCLLYVKSIHSHAFVVTRKTHSCGC